MSLTSLINSGIAIVRASSGEPEKTLIVLGAARGGTSMVAGLLYRMGVFMGTRMDKVVYEDVELSGAIESGDFNAVARMIRERNDKYGLWGWKRPAVVDHIGQLHGSLRNPHYIAVFRDIAAIAVRNRISVNSELLSNMKQSLNHFLRIVNFIETVDAPAMVISYEKALLNGESLVTSLAEFAGIPAEKIPGGAAQLATEFIKTNIPEYLDATRSNRIMGRVSAIQTDLIQGWALQRGRNDAVSVRLIVNGRAVATVDADLYQEDLKTRGVHPNGHCGFEFRLPPERGLKEGDQVRIRVRGDVKDLQGTPARFKG